MALTVRGNNTMQEGDVCCCFWWPLEVVLEVLGSSGPDHGGGLVFSHKRWLYWLAELLGCSGGTWLVWAAHGAF